MCVSLCGVWSLKKARLRCDRLCWWPLNFNTLHNYTCIKIHKVYPSQKWWDITELLVHPASLDMGGAPPHTNHRIRQAARGEEQVGLLKNNAPVANRSLWNMAWRSRLLALSALGSLKHGVTLSALGSLGSWLSGTSLFNIAGAALVTSLPARALTWTLSRHRLNQPSIRRLEGTTSKNNELNAYGRKESFLWRHAAAATSLVFPPESTRRRTNQPTWFPRTKTRVTHLKETKHLPACLLSTTKAST